MVEDQTPPREPEPMQTAEPQDGSRRRRVRPAVVAGIAALAVLVLVGAGISWFVLTRPAPEDTAQAYAEAWEAGDFDAMAALAAGAEGLADAYSEVADHLGVESAEVALGETTGDGDTATTPFTAALALSEAGEWSFDGELPLIRADGEWLVDFSPAVIHPELGGGQTLVRSNEWDERGHILAADGAQLDADDATGSVQMITGTVAPAAEEDLEDLGPAYAEGDPFGQFGIQAAQEAHLAGTPAVTIRAAESGAEADAEGAEEGAEVGRIDGTPGEDVQTSLDPSIQDAAAAAIGGESEPTALVAVRPSTGEVLASANVPGGFDRAFDGQFAPGSSFKIITYEALLGAGMGMDESMDCPRTVEVGGLSFRNAGDAEYGQQSVTDAFATSCNTALIQEVEERLDAGSLVAAAEEFGFNSDLDIGMSTFAPEFPIPDGLSLLAQASIGQGQTLTSPLHMATVPAAVADGQWRSPVLVTEPESGDAPEPRPVAHAEDLRSMMRAVITDGTGSDAGFTGNVSGKTGTAEFGVAEDDEELESHAWFVGYDADLDVAVAVVVDGGGGGGAVAAPLAADFLNAL